jgi:hypothetical protein
MTVKAGNMTLTENPESAIKKPQNTTSSILDGSELLWGTNSYPNSDCIKHSFHLKLGMGSPNNK